ncbi:phosphatidate cytidylyltransferase, partial [Seonamhaeicola marinus]
MKEMLTRGLSGLVYIGLLIGCMQNKHALIILFFVFGLITLAEFKKLIQLKSIIPFIIFVIMYFVFVYWKLILNTRFGLDEATQI